MTATAGAAKVTAALGSSSASANLTVDALKPVLLTCSPNPLTPGALLICRVDLNAAPLVAVSVTNTSNAAVIRVPAVVTVPAGTNNGRFVSYSQAGAPLQTVRISSTFGGVTVISDVTVKGALRTSSAKVSESSVQSASSTESVDISSPSIASDQDSERPAITSVVNGATLSTAGACSPGAAAIVMGAGLGSGDLDHVHVEVNGETVPVMVASPSQVTFQCPDLAPVRRWILQFVRMFRFRTLFAWRWRNWDLDSLRSMDSNGHAARFYSTTHQS